MSDFNSGLNNDRADGSAPVVSEMKIFNAQDGQGLSLAHTMGIQTGFITGRRSPAVAKRAEELKVTFVYLGQAKKTQAFEECMGEGGRNGGSRSCLFGGRFAGHSAGAARGSCGVCGGRRAEN